MMSARYIFSLRGQPREKNEPKLTGQMTIARHGAELEAAVSTRDEFFAAIQKKSAGMPFVKFLDIAFDRFSDAMSSGSRFSISILVGGEKKRKNVSVDFTGL